MGANGQRNLFEAPKLGRGRRKLGDGPSFRFGIARVHAGQIGGEEGGLLAAFSCFDLEDDVKGVLGLTGGEDLEQTLVRSAQLIFELWDFRSE